ncbi:MAG: TIGR00730 family Rossman fold protein [Candidatus Zambryskibacteria bacterium]|nr:TIGR00730 family Rossman fold protein [Candidatus Zambryskibacteria bacterium]
MDDATKQKLKDDLKLSRPEMEMIATERVADISKEFKEGFKFLSDYPKSITFFGSTMSVEGDPYYESARTLSGRLVKELGYSIVSGGGPGIMEAADRGAYEAGGDSLGLLINLPNQQPTNPYITKSIGFHYFFARKVCLTFGAEVFVFFPGGFGTLDEFYEIITLIQTQKIESVPIICVGSEYWNKVKDFMHKEMLERGFIAPEHVDLFTITDSHDEIIEMVRKIPVRISIPLSARA